MPRLKDTLTDAGYGLGWSVVCRLPESWARRSFRLPADSGDDAALADSRGSDEDMP
jgi:hypothetical protein